MLSMSSKRVGHLPLEALGVLTKIKSENKISFMNELSYLYVIR